MTTSFFELLECRQFLCATAAPVSAHATATLRTQVVEAKHKLARPTAAPMVSVTHYAGTATSAAGEKSSIKFLVVYLKGVREGIVYVNNGMGNKVQIPFAMSKSLTFSFPFTVAGQKDIASGKLSADGKTLTGTWMSANGSQAGTFSASRA